MRLYKSQEESLNTSSPRRSPSEHVDHVAIMREDWNFIPKIVEGEKTIESRWYLSRKAPWGKVKKGDTVYFKNSGGPVWAKASVRKVLEFEDLDPQKVRKILREYGKFGRLGFSDIRRCGEMYKSKKYCILIFLERAKKVKSFRIDKTGFGMSSAWLCVGKIRKVKIIS